mmetsp:Transcript_17055/g.34128  ORF Transcript_17055/g.34128 Transcript_17055/m.34128 type:complete len:246 (-) Transcript_17055:159-896(-)
MAAKFLPLGFPDGADAAGAAAAVVAASAAAPEGGVCAALLLVAADGDAADLVGVPSGPSPAGSPVAVGVCSGGRPAAFLASFCILAARAACASAEVGGGLGVPLPLPLPPPLPPVPPPAVPPDPEADDEAASPVVEDGGGPNSNTGAFFVPSVASPFTMHTDGWTVQLASVVSHFRNVTRRDARASAPPPPLPDAAAFLDPDTMISSYEDEVAEEPFMASFVFILVSTYLALEREYTVEWAQSTS